MGFTISNRDVVAVQQGANVTLGTVAVVLSVRPRSDAARNGLRPGMQICAVGQRHLPSHVPYSTTTAKVVVETWLREDLEEASSTILTLSSHPPGHDAQQQP